MVDLLSLCFHAAVGDDQKAVKECFVQVCMDCFTDVKNYPTNRNHPLSENQNAAKICDLVILIAIQEEQLKLAEDCLEFCTDELDTMPGQLREDTIKLYVQEMINAGYGKKALQGVLYAIQAKMANAEELGRTLANAESVALSPIEKRRLDVSFSGSMTWEALN